MLTLGHERATLVGHSLGGGVAMQFTYQFPEMVERLVLVSSGGLGPDVSPILRAAALPGADLFISRHGRRRAAGRLAARPRPRRASACGPAPTSPRSRAATPRSPTPSAARPSSRPCARWSAPTASGSPPLDRLYLAEALPLLIVWGDARPDHPGRPRPKRPTRRCPAAASRSSRASATCPSSRPRPLHRRPRALPRGDRAGPVRPRGVARPLQERLGGRRRGYAPDRIRTCGLSLRRATLYPAELRALDVAA